MEQKKWYDYTILTNMLLIVFFPVGLYALWKSKAIANWWKIMATILIVLIVIINLGTNEENSYPESPGTVPGTSQKHWSQNQKDSIALVERINIIEKRKSATISASDLVASYTNNEVLADNNFKGKQFYVEGIIDDIGKDILDEIYVTLKSDDLIPSVQCYIDNQEQVARLRKGQKITVLGDCDGLMMNVLMSNCKLVENIENL